MFEKVFGLPAHPLVVHAAVVLIPATVITALIYVIVPRLRPKIGWLLVLLAVSGAVASVIAVETGDRFAKHLGVTPDIAKHGGFGLDTRNMALLLAVVSIVLVGVEHLRTRGTNRNEGYGAAYGDEWTQLPGRTQERRARAGSSSGSTMLTVVSFVLMLALLASAGGAAFSVARAGDTGARMVWEGR